MLLRLHHLRAATMKDLHWIMTCSSRCSSITTDTKAVIQQDKLPKKKRTYEDAIQKLNGLQSNAAVLHAARKNQDKLNHRNIPEATLFAKRADITIDKINTLPIIHVSGTKGKGSVCAFCESILRTHGLKTGFYSSPHLVEVRERIRINGLPLEKDDFVTSFFEVYDKLERSKPEYDDAMPAYFRFLTIMAFHVFLKEKVDVAVVEVGIGGEFDCTNIIKLPTVVGITSLGMDHQFILGDTVDKIAWHKAGICKPDKPAFTVPQPDEAMKVVLSRANEIGSLIQCVGPIESNDFGDHLIQLGLSGDHQRNNASLAVQLCRRFLEVERSESFQVAAVNGPSIAKRVKQAAREKENVSVAQRVGMSIAEPVILPESFISGLRDCYWAGRNQSFVHDRVTYYMDAAHTVRSIEACREWFLEEADQESLNNNGNIARILVFNSTGKRDSMAFLKILLDCQFDGVVFCPNVISGYDADQNPPDLSYTHHSTKPLSRLHLLKQEFDQLVGSTVNEGQQVNGHASPTITTKAKCVVVPSITDALQWAACAKDSNLSPPRSEDPVPPDAAISAGHLQVLVTGSVHLVGGVIKVLNPELVIHK